MCPVTTLNDGSNNVTEHSPTEQNAIEHNAIELGVTPLRLQTPNDAASVLQVQALVVRFSRPQALILPGEIARTVLPADLSFTQPVVVFGQAPTWLVGRLISQLVEQSQAKSPSQQTASGLPWIGCYDARSQQVVVVASTVVEIAVGDALPAVLNPQRCPAILVGGPPDSGKSVFSNALRVALKERYPDRRVYLHRASWDGEGNWTYESGTQASGKPELIKKLVARNEFRIHEKAETATLIPGYFKYHARAVDNLRQITDCLIVDVGGMPQVEKQPLMEVCTHYVVVSRSAAAVEAWHGLCGEALQPLAIVNSVLEAKCTILNAAPLEMVAGPWVSAQSAVMPEEILEQVDKLVAEGEH